MAISTDDVTIDDVLVSVWFDDPDDLTSPPIVRVSLETEDGVDGASFDLVVLVAKAIREADHDPMALKRIRAAIDEAEEQVKLRG